jgi:hypothetical protein
MVTMPPQDVGDALLWHALPVHSSHRFQRAHARKRYADAPRILEI